MNIVFYAIGQELLQGKIQDRNTAVLAKALQNWGLSLEYMAALPDSMETLSQKISHALSNFDICILSGGLGPTLDDITASAIANAFGVEMVESSEYREVVKSNCLKRKFQPQGDSYKYSPAGAIPLLNPVGIAPGLICQSPTGSVVCALPGVPREFQAMLRPMLEQLSQLIPKFESQALSSIVYKTKGIPEEKIFKSLCPKLWGQLKQFGTPFSLPHPVNVDIGIYLDPKESQNRQQIKEKLDEIIFQGPLEEHIWTDKDISIEELVLERAREKSLTIATAESCTGGLVASRLTDISGSSDVVEGGVVSYSNRVKERVLSVNPATLKSFGAVSLETAKEMVEGLENCTDAELMVATTGIAGPGGGSEQKPVGTVCVGIKRRGKPAHAKKYQLRGERTELKYRFSQVALFDLLELIEKT